MSDPVATLLRTVADMIDSGLPRPNWILGTSNPFCTARPSVCFASDADLGAWAKALGAVVTTRESDMYRPYEIREVVTTLAGLTARLWADVTPSGAGETLSTVDAPAPHHDKPS